MTRSFNIFTDLSVAEEKEATTSLSDQREVAEGFGKLYPSAQESQQREEHSDDEQDLTSDIVSRKELEKGRLSRDGKYNPHGRSSGSRAGTVRSPRT